MRPHARRGRAAAGTSASARKPANESRSVWPISMFCGLPMSVAAEPTFAAQASASRNGHRVEPPARAALDEQRRHREADDVVREHGRERRRRRPPPRRAGPRGRDGRGDDPPRHPGVEAAQAELGGDDHQAEEERERRHVDRRPGRGRGDPLGRDEGERAEEGDPGAVEGEAGDLARAASRGRRRRRRRGRACPGRYPFSRRSRRSPSSSVASSLQKAKRTRWRTRFPAAKALTGIAATPTRSTSVRQKVSSSSYPRGRMSARAK